MPTPTPTAPTVPAPTAAALDELQAGGVIAEWGAGAPDSHPWSRRATAWASTRAADGSLGDYVEVCGWSTAGAAARLLDRVRCVGEYADWPAIG